MLQQVPARKDVVYSFQVPRLAITARTHSLALAIVLPSLQFWLSETLLADCFPLLLPIVRVFFLCGGRFGPRERRGGESGLNHRLFSAPRPLAVSSTLHRASTMVPRLRARAAMWMLHSSPVMLRRFSALILLGSDAC